MAVPVMKGRAAENESERGALVIRTSLSSDILLRPDRPLPPSLLTTPTRGKREGAALKRSQTPALSSPDQSQMLGIIPRPSTLCFI